MDNKQIKWGVILTYIAQGVSILSGLIYTPIMLRLLGQSEYGLYQIATSLISYLGLLSFGFSSGYLRLYFQFRVKQEDDRIANLNGMYLILFSIISIAALVLGFAMILGRRSLFGTGLSPYELEKLKPLMVLMLINLIITFLSSVFECYLSAYNQFVFQRSLQVLKGILNPFLTLPLLLLGYGSVAMCVVSTGLVFLNFLCTVFYCFRKLKMRFAFNNIESGVFKNLSHFTFYIFLSSVIDKINLSLDNFIIGRISGTVMVSVYAVGAQINGFYNMISTSIGTIFIPTINRIVAESDDNEELTAHFIRISKFLFLILVFVLLGFVFYGQTFVMLWAGAGYADSYWVALTLMIGSLIPLIQISGIEIQRAKNMHKARSLVYLVMAIINVCISIPLIKTIGVIGASIGTMFSMLIGSGLFMNWYYEKRIGLDMRKYWKTLLALCPCYVLPVISATMFRLFSNRSNSVELVSATVFSTLFAASLFVKARRTHNSIKEWMLFVM